MAEKELKDDVICLSQLDVVFSSNLSVHFFNSEIDFERLRSSFDKLLEVMPILSSVCEKNDDGTLRVRFVKPSNVEFFKKYVDEDLSKLYIPTEDGIVSHDDKRKIYDLNENIVVNEKYMLNPALGTPLFKVTVVEMKSKKTLLIVCGSHVMDGNSRILLVKIWSDIYNGKDVNKRFTFDRNWTQLSDPDFDPYKQPIERFRHIHEFNIPEKERGYRKVPSGEAVLKRIHFSSEKIAHMKKLVKEYVKDEEYRFSSNDCITAFLWRLYASIEGKYYGSKFVPLRFVANIRPKISKIDDSYFGNGTILPLVDLSSIETILTCPFPELVTKIRGTVNHVNEEMVQTYIDLYGSFWKKGNKEFGSFLGGMVRKSGLVVNDWRFINLLLPKFGDAACERCVATTGKLSVVKLGHWNILLGLNGDGLDAYVKFEKRVYEEIKDYDLTTFETLEIMKKK